MGWIFLAVVAPLLVVWFRHITRDVDAEY